MRQFILHRFAMAALALGALAAGPAGAQDRPNALTGKESQQGWMLLFDGKSMEGWKAYQPGDWTVQDGALVCGGTTPSWLGTEAEYSDYVLKLEFRGKENVNSGVFLRSQKEGAPHRTGYELQIWDVQPAGFNTGSLVGSVKASPAKTLADEWNRYEITANGDHFVIVLNGATVLDAHDSQHASGVVGFQCQKDNRIEFRGIKLLPVRK